MITKEQLQSYVGLRLEAENITERLARLRAEAQLPPMRNSDGSQHTPGAADRLARSVEALLEYEQRTAPRLAQIRAQLAAIEAAVDALPDPLEREVLRLRYLDAKNGRLVKWRKVAYAIYGDDDDSDMQAVFRLHDEALKHLSMQNSAK